MGHGRHDALDRSRGRPDRGGALLPPGRPRSRHARAGGVPRSPVRRRAGLGALPRGPRRARRAAASCRRRSTRRLREAGARRPPIRRPSSWPSPAPTILTHGTDEQKQRFLRPMFTGEERWCQLFSEPGAGLATSPAWPPGPCATATSGSSTARRCGTRSPTSPTGGCSSPAPTPMQPKHKGMTYFAVDMHSPRRRGPAAAPDHRARPSSTRCTSPTCAIPDANRIGDVGEGWRVSPHDAHERAQRHRRRRGGTRDGALAPIADAVEIWHDAARRSTDGPVHARPC